MNINEILKEYDEMFGKAELVDIERYLVGKLNEARAKNLADVQVTLLNEIIGFCRDTGQKDKALQYCTEFKSLLVSMGIEGSTVYATGLLNIANAYRAFGLLSQATELYEEVLRIYNGSEAVDMYMYASLYNNWSLVYQASSDFVKAAEMSKKALELLRKCDGTSIQQATTMVNLAEAILQMYAAEIAPGKSEVLYEEAVAYLRQALDIFEKDGCRDFHYSAALVAMGDAFASKNDYIQAASYYKKGMDQIEKFTGRNGNYAKVLEKYNYVKQPAEGANRSGSGDAKWISNMERCREFYETYGRKMIHELFPSYEHRIAVGLVGEGSDCFGFDDEISMDHDYGIGFCMWLTDEDYREIGEKLQVAYEQLVSTVYDKKEIDRFLQSRRGVFTINGFYSELLHVTYDYTGAGKMPDLAGIAEFRLAVATNGSVFRDDMGDFTDVRNNLLSYYSDDFLRRKIAGEMHEFSQYAQSNYPRMMARGDQVTANLCIAKATENAMNLVYLLNGCYAPYYKWKRKGLERFDCSVKLQSILDKIAKTAPQSNAWSGIKYSAVAVNMNDEIVSLFEQAAQILVEALKNRGFITGDDLFLEGHIGEVLNGVKSVNDKSAEHEKLAEEVLGLEWNQFQYVHNEGGRASCQDNYETFYIMRKSQYMAWPDPLLKSFREDLRDADRKGWNLITEKYARMMKDTNPEKYAALEQMLPARTHDRMMLQEAIIKIQVEWMNGFAAEYPKISGNSRSISTAADSENNTSYETYLRGEIGTYSEATFVLYCKFITEKLSAGGNLAYEIMENTVNMYGYKSLADAESKLS